MFGRPSVNLILFLFPLVVLWSAGCGEDGDAEDGAPSDALTTSTGTTDANGQAEITAGDTRVLLTVDDEAGNSVPGIHARLIARREVGALVVAYDETGTYYPVAAWDSHFTPASQKATDTVTRGQGLETSSVRIVVSPVTEACKLYAYVGNALPEIFSTTEHTLRFCVSREWLLREAETGPALFFHGFPGSEVISIPFGAPVGENALAELDDTFGWSPAYAMVAPTEEREPTCESDARAPGDLCLYTDVLDAPALWDEVPLTWKVEGTCDPTGPDCTDNDGDGYGAGDDCLGPDCNDWNRDVRSGCEPPVVGEFVLIPAGTFTMGSPPEELGREDDENQHEVTLTRDFYLQATEVTQEQWESLMGSDPNPLLSGNYPVDQVNWWDGLAYANALSLSEGLPECYTLTGCTGRPGRADFEEPLQCSGLTVNGASGDPYDCAGYRLPTEAEWEYAYRAGTTTAFYSGEITTVGCEYDPNLDAIGWYCDNAERYNTEPVAQKAPNAWGLYDMSANADEWCWDWYGPYPEGSVTDPTGPETGSDRIVRGGGTGSPVEGARAASRSYSGPDQAGGGSGFRLARTAPSP